MEAHPWKTILFGVILVFLGWELKGFFVINYFIGGAGILLGLWQLYKRKKLF